MAEKRYISGGSHGWLNVKREPSGQVIALPEYLQVEWQELKQGRDYFKPLEGVEQDKSFSVLVGNLKHGSPAYKSAAQLTFTLSTEKLVYPGGTVKAITDSINPIGVGVHPIQIPDFPHSGGTGYMSQSLYAKSWFYLGTGVAIAGNNDRYLHTGTASAGCVTVDPSAWTNLYKYLILCRRGDGKTVGSITVHS